MDIVKYLACVALLVAVAPPASAAGVQAICMKVAVIQSGQRSLCDQRQLPDLRPRVCLQQSGWARQRLQQSRRAHSGAYHRFDDAKQFGRQSIGLCQLRRGKARLPALPRRRLPIRNLLRDRRQPPIK